MLTLPKRFKSVVRMASQTLVSSRMRTGKGENFFLGQAAALRNFLQTQPIQKRVELLRWHGVLWNRHSHVRVRFFDRYHGLKYRFANGAASPAWAIQAKIGHCL